MIAMLYAVSALILVRCVFRIVEYAMGADAYPLKHEWTLYIFDAVLMAVTMAIFHVRYPSDIPLPSNSKDMISDGETLVETRNG